MGSNTFVTKSAGDIISEDDPNQYKEGLDGDVVPRDADGAPADLAGDLGSTLYRWASAYIQKIYLGAIASAISIEETAAALLIKVSGTTKMKVDADGLDGAFLKALSVPYAALDASAQWKGPYAFGIIAAHQTWVVPAGCNLIIVELIAGGGGGGGGDTNSSGAGGGGGSGSIPQLFAIRVTPGETLDIHLGAGGAGGAAGSNGGDGGSSTIKRDSDTTTIVTVRGGNGGKAASGTTPGAGGAGGIYGNGLLTAGGKGADVSTANADDGDDSFWTAGGSASGSAKGGGGGGASRSSVGGDGGSAANGSAGFFGAGGGGGAAQKSGGNGGDGSIFIYYTGETPT
jgi:hypothetical protein